MAKRLPEIAAACPSNQTGGCVPTKLTYTTGPLAFQGNVFNAALFVQDDWKVNKILTLSGGLRWESQNHIADHSDWAPRVAFAYALDGHKKGAVSKTVLRGGFGFFYDRFSTANLMNHGGAEWHPQEPDADRHHRSCLLQRRKPERHQRRRGFLRVGRGGRRE